MYFFVKNIEKTIILSPDSLGPKIDSFIQHKLIQSVEGKCHPKYGWVIAVVNIIDHGQGQICENADVIFKVRYNAVTFKPISQEVFDGIVKEVLNYGLHVTVGPMTFFISEDNIPSDFEFVENPDPCFQNQQQKIQVNSKIRFRMKNYDQKGEELYGIGSLADDYLGLIEA